MFRAPVSFVNAWFGLVWLGLALPLPAFQSHAGAVPATRQIRLERAWSESYSLAAGETVEVSAGMPAPSQLPANGRVAVSWTAPSANASLRKVLHALDPDVYFVYRAPVAGKYELEIRPLTDEQPIFNTARWRETGVVSTVSDFPKTTSWPAGTKVSMRVAVKPVEFGASARGMIVEVEPNNSIEQAQNIALEAGNQDQTIHITGGADDIEYFDNGLVGESGDDWFRLEYKGTEPRLLTANLTTADPLVVARLRFYGDDRAEYKEGMNANERVHQQIEEHRTEINRILKPGGVYFLRAEANAPGYEIELRVRRPAPYSDPREAIRQGLYDHLAQVDAWLLNRPRGASVERRIRDTGNVLGTSCMSCHTQSGVWGAAFPIQQGYRPENVQNFRHLINVMYESLRPTNVLQDAANNTSLAPFDLGDGPAGTRVAGHNVATLERLMAPRLLHSRQQIRTANFVLQSNDPGGVNAAGPGSNVGQAVVFNYTGEILRTAWDKTHDPKYLEALEDKAEKMLGVMPKFTDDMAHRIEFFRNVFPRDYIAMKGNTDEAHSFMARVDAQLAVDEHRLRISQREDGTWGFTPGVVDSKEDPSPTAQAVWALAALGYTDQDPVVAKGVAALLRLQDPYGRWNKAALTGFVTTSYALHALARLYPETPRLPQHADFVPSAGESLNDTIARFRALAQESDPKFVDLILPGAAHESPQVRYWAMIALGALHCQDGVAPLVQHLDDPVKMVREAARWGLRQTLLDDHGWSQIYAAYAKGNDLTREQIAATLIMRADAVSTKSRVDFPRLTAMLDRMINRDANPAVRAWSVRAAWNWWIWNPPVRAGVNHAFLTMLERQESSALVENAQRYQTQALFIVNGHRANGTNDHQYLELAKLFEAISQKLDRANPRLVNRVVAVAGTYYNMAGGDGGPGQMGYTTPGSTDMVGKAVMTYWKRAEDRGNADGVRLSLEAAAGASYEPLQKKLLAFTNTGPENLRPVAATSMSDPRFISLPGTQEFVEPLIEQVNRGAADADRRDQLSKPVLRLFSRGHWNIPQTDEQQRLLYGSLIPKLDNEKSEAQWYLADQLGRLLANNPDLQTQVLVSMFPRTFRNPLEEYFWLPSVKWMLTYDTPMPEARGNAPAGSDALAEVRARALALYSKQLSPTVDERLHGTALDMVHQTALRSRPEVLAALDKIDADPYKTYDRDLQEIIAKDTAPGKPPMNDPWMQNLAYFRDYVVPEMHRPNRYDELACFGCHGVAGRVPSMELAAPERNGLIRPKELWKDYRILLERVNEEDVERSKLLRKPLNIQSSKEDGHQGGVRYKPDERGYQIIRRWVLDVAALRKNNP